MTNTVLSDDLVIDGNVKSSTAIVINGTVTGDVDAAAVEIGASGSVDGKINAKDVEVHGTLKGSMSAVSVSVHSTAVVRASITAEEIATERGSRISGKLNITGAKGD